MEFPVPAMPGVVARAPPPGHALPPGSKPKSLTSPPLAGGSLDILQLVNNPPLHAEDPV